MLQKYCVKKYYFPSFKDTSNTFVSTYSRMFMKLAKIF